MSTISIKLALVGDAGVGKSSVLLRYVDSRFDSTITLGVSFMEKTISVNKNTKCNMSIWDLGGSFSALLPIVCESSVAVVFMFDLTRRESLESIKTWYKQVRAINKTAIPFLCGTKFDLFNHVTETERDSTISLARKYANAMKAPLIFTSALETVNVGKLFKIIFLKVFDLPIDVAIVTEGAIVEGFMSSIAALPLQAASLSTG
jgi:GTP-binding protein of the ras superfamily involved in termination of M-phase